jgi:hypothetical protein
MSEWLPQVLQTDWVKTPRSLSHEEKQDGRGPDRRAMLMFEQAWMRPEQNGVVCEICGIE